jgi:hypothetical protein
MPATVTSYGGSPLLKCINSLRTHAVLLAPMCQEILQDDELKKNFLADAPNGHSVRERAWEMQQKNIKSFVKNYVMENIVNIISLKVSFVSSLIRSLLEHQMILTHSRCIRAFIENDRLLDQNRMLCELNQQANTRINDLEGEIHDLRGARQQPS